ncbi:MAG: hypothetical protein AAGD25_19060 [Cyanobacteria bacterium P01_F01_bin.150]
MSLNIANIAQAIEPLTFPESNPFHIAGDLSIAEVNALGEQTFHSHPNTTVRILEQSITVTSTLDDEWSRKQAFVDIAKATGIWGNQDQGTVILDQLLNVSLDNPHGAKDLQVIAAAYGALGEHAKATAVLDKALASVPNIVRPDRQPDALISIATVYSQIGDRTTGREVLQSALLLASKYPPEFGRQHQLQLLTTAQIALGQGQEAVNTFELRLAELLQNARSFLMADIVKQAQSLDTDAHKVEVLVASLKTLETLAHNNAGQNADQSEVCKSMIDLALALENPQQMEKALEAMRLTANRMANMVSDALCIDVEELPLRLWLGPQILSGSDMLSAIALAYLERDQPARASEVFEDAIAAVNETTYEQYVSSNLPALERTNDIQRQRLYRQTKSNTLAIIAHLLPTLNDVQLAAPLLASVTRAVESSEAPEVQWYGLISVGFAHSRLQDQSKARSLMDIALSTVRQVGMNEPAFASGALTELSAAYLDVGMEEQAATLLQNVRIMVDGDAALWYWGILASQYGQFTQRELALEGLDQLVVDLDTLDDDFARLMLMIDAAESYGQIDGVERLMTELDLILGEVQQKSEFQAAVLERLARVYGDSGATEQAVEVLEKAITIAKIMEDPIDKSRTFRELATIYQNWNQEQQASAMLIEAVHATASFENIWQRSDTLRTLAYHAAEFDNVEHTALVLDAILPMVETLVMDDESMTGEQIKLIRAIAISATQP